MARVRDDARAVAVALARSRAGVTQATRRLPLARPWIDEREEELVLEVLRSGRLSLGPTIDRFEELIAERVGAPYAAAVSSGTAGLHLLVRAAGIGEGDEVITTPLSFAATANCFLFEGATPVFVDVDPRTWNISPAAVEAAITDRTKGIVAVDMFGYPCELDELTAIAERHGLALIEDSAEALGAEYKGRQIGSHGPPCVFGFYPNKQLATGEGGVVLTHDEETWKLVRSLRNQGRRYGGGGWFDHVRLGFNYRWTDVQAAIGIAQLEKLDRALELRSEAAARYAGLLGDADGVELAPADDADHRRSWFVYVLALAPELDRARVMAEMRDRGVDVAEYVPCIHLQTYMRDQFGFGEGLCPVAEGIAARTIALPFFPQIEPADQEYVADSLRAAMRATT
ncbi:MAG TPA: DegT/DnrJ/EryC1/StrS family aminotransferase [Gaiellaceae bacterium]|nr:DegT/DnrJ/EryC1/StrS family aminotransferase [Gaiellaceae bacterium]